MVLELLLSDMPEEAVPARLRARPLGEGTGRRASRASRRARSPAPTCRIRPSRSTSTPASSARAACAPAARCRSTTSSATPSAASTRRSCSTSTTRWAASTCVACGECVQACPTGALIAGARRRRRSTADRTVDSVCPYCGVGCQLTYHVKDDKILRVEGRDGLANHGRLCVKGRYGFDYVAPPAAPDPAADPASRARRRRADFTMDPDDVARVFREASWEEALDLAGGGLRAIRDAHGPHALAGLRLGQGQQRGGLPVPEAGAHRLSAPTTSTTARGCATPRAWRRCSKASARARCRIR